MSVGQHNIKVDTTPIAVAKHQKVSEYEAIMRQRWLEANNTIPLIDKNDIEKEVPLVNGGKVLELEKRR